MVFLKIVMIGKRKTTSMNKRASVSKGALPDKKAPQVTPAKHVKLSDRSKSKSPAAQYIDEGKKPSKLRKRAEKSSKVSGMNFLSLAEESPNMIFINYKGRVVYANLKCVEIMGYARDEFYSESFHFLNIIAPEYRETATKSFQKHMQGKEVPPYEYAILTKGGKRLEVIINTKLIGYENDKAILGIVTDITERSKAEVMLQKNRSDLMVILDNLPFLAWLKDSEGRFIAVNVPFAQASGHSSPEDLIGKTDIDIWPKHLAESYRTDDNTVMLSGKKKAVEEIISDQGVDRWFETYKAPLFNVNGKVTGTTGFARDISERKQAEEALRQSEERQKFILESVQAGILLIDAETHVIADVNPVAAHMIGSTREQLIGSICNKHVCPAEVGKCPITDLGQQIDNSDRLLITADGTPRSILKTVVPVTIHGRKHLLESFIDITERKQAEKEHLLNETRISSLLELSRMTDQADQDLTDFTLEKAIELTGSTIGYLAFMNEDETVLSMYSWSRQAMKECLIESKPLVYPVETTGLWGETVRQRQPIITNDYLAPNPVKKGYPEGHVHVRRHMNIPLFDGGRIVLVAGVGNKEEPYGDPDIKQLTLLMDGMWKIIKQKRAEEELRKSEEAIYESYSAQSLINILLSESLENITLEEFLQKALNMILSIPWIAFEAIGSISLVEDKADALMMKAHSNIPEMLKELCAQVPFGKCLCGKAAQAQKILFAERINERHEICYEGMVPHGHYSVPILSGGRALGVLNIYLKEGHIRNQKEEEFLSTVANTLSGIIMRKKAEEEQEKLHAQLLQAQKMEAVGQLSGGIAHDFNNILTAIIGYGNLLKMQVEKDSTLSTYMKYILDSAERAANLTQDLLAFSRKQVINPKPINVNEVIKGAEKILLRLIGADVELSTHLSDKDLIVMADSVQMEHVLMNLATNARDAMPGGGNLLISSDFTEIDERFINMYGYGKKGKYAVITVSDTGVGIDEQTKNKIFEPFFTTKEVGKGTGLGLSMVYGIVKQHNGFINVYSEPGKGTTFKLYLPLIHAKIADTEGIELPISKRGIETILIAEDDAMVRKFMREVLEDAGYTVIETKDGEDAIDVFIENKDRIKLLILDVIMPKKNGKEVYETLKESNPYIKAIFTSGYSADILHKKGIISEGPEVILKPVSSDKLLRKIRDLLDQ